MANTARRYAEDTRVPIGRRRDEIERILARFEFARLVCEIQPRTFVMENVTGLLSMVTPEGLPVLDAFCLAVADGGYGEYDALRKAMGAAGPGARAGVRKSRKAQRGAEPEPADVDELDDEQLDLFAEVADG